jgi:tripartite-type tricarboxylate transporter receptor subunit TctC
MALAMVGAVLASAACGGPAPAPTAVPVAPTKAAAQPTQAAAPTKAVVSSYPTKDITLIVPFSPGGGFDLQSRIFAPLWQQNLPQKVNVIVDNQKGAGGNLGSMKLMKSPPDGLTIAVLSPATLAQAQVTGQLEKMDIRKLSYIGQLSYEDGAVVVSAASNLKTLADLKTKELRFGVTTDSIFSAAVLCTKLSLKCRNVMFDGSPEQALAAMRGDIDIMLDSVSTMKRSTDNGEGKLVGLMVIGDQRTSAWSTLPTSKELGLDLGDLRYVAGSARVLAGPAGIPADVLKIMQDSAGKALSSPDFKAGMEKAAFISAPGTGDDALTTVQKIVGIYETNKTLLMSLGQ